MAVASKVRLVDIAAKDFEKITVSTVSIGLTTAKIGIGFFLTNEGNDIRYRIDGGDPTTTDGHVLLDGQTLQVLDRTAALNLRMIRINADSTVQVSHF